MISDQIIEKFRKQVRDYFLDFLYKDEDDLPNWAAEMQELRHLLLRAYERGVGDALGAVPGLEGRQIVRMYGELTEWPKSEYDDDVHRAEDGRASDPQKGP